MKLSGRLFLALSITPLLPAQIQFSTDVLSMNPLGYWPLNGNANDSSGHGNNGSLMNGLGFANFVIPLGSAAIPAAAFMSVQNQFVAMPAGGSSVFNFSSTHAFSAMAWVRTLGLRHMAIISKLDRVATFGWSLAIDSQNGRPSLLVLSGGNPVLGVESTVSVNEGAWHLVALTYDGSGSANGVKLYIDGVGVATTASGSFPGSGSVANSTPLTIGAEDDGSDPFEGYVNEAAVFGAALTPAQILQLADDAVTARTALGQFAFGGGWYSAVYFSNTNSASVSFLVNFTLDNGTPMNVAAAGGASTMLTIAPGATSVIVAPNVGSLVQGYVTAALPIGVTGYAVFRQSVPGVADQEAVAPLSFAGSTQQTLVYDDTLGLITAVAIVNPSGVAATVSATAYDVNGNVIATSSSVAVLQPFSKTEARLRDLAGLSGVAGTRGTVTFSVTTGAVGALGLRFNGVAFSSIPAVNGRQLSTFQGDH